MKNRKTLSNIFVGIVIFILSFMLVINISRFVKELQDSIGGYKTSEDHLLYYVQEGNYARMVERIQMNEFLGVKPSQTMKECYAIARYYEAATFYKAFIENNNLEKAAGKKEIMDQQEQLAGEMKYIINEINESLEINY